MGTNLSYSAAQKYITSPRSWYLHYVLRLRPKDLSSPLVFGNAIDIALNFLLTQKQENTTLDVEQAKGLFLMALIGQVVNGKEVDLRIKGVVKFSKADLDESLIAEYDLEVPPGHDRAWYSLYQKGMLMIDAYVEQVMPELQEVFFVQKKISITNEDGDAFTGVVDFCARYRDKVYIFDNKTSSVKFADDATDTSEQLATYFEAERENLHLDGVGYVIIPKTIRRKKMPRVPIEIKVGPVHEAVIDSTFSMYDKVLSGIKLGKFPCTPEKCCAMPWPCSYRRYCESDGQDLTGLVTHEKSGK